MIRPKKALGQNFLNDESVAQALVSAGEVTKADLVLEVGAGAGFVTRVLAPQAGKVLAVEFDRDLMTPLENTIKGFKNVEVVAGDILKTNIGAYFAKSEKFESFKIIGSIPYQITSPLIHKIMKTPLWSVAALLIQKEVAEKICAQPPQATYLSNLTATFAKTGIVKDVPKTAFSPSPQVDGAIIKVVRDSNISKRQNIRAVPFANFLHKGFAHPRKMLRNVFTETQLESAGVAPTARAQELTLKNWLTLYRRVES